MNIKSPKISVIVPVYNVEAYIAKCIESIINQTYTNLEIIIVDDGSTDKSGDICNCYAKQDNRIIIIHQEHQGVSMARNSGIEIASGEYIGWVDSDDWVAPDMYETLYNNAVKYDADISSCNIINISESKKNPNNNILNIDENITILEGFNKIADNIYNSNNFICNRLFKHYLFNDIRFPKGKLYENAFIMHKLTDNANKVVLSSQCKYYDQFRKTDITLMDIVEAYVERYKYISNKYPELEKVCRNNIFINLLWGINKAYIEGNIEIHKEAMQKTIDSIRCYDYIGCGLSAAQQNAVKLIFDNMRKFILGLKIQNKKRELTQNVKMTKKTKAFFYSYFRPEVNEDILEYPHFWIDERYIEPIRQLKKIGQNYDIDMIGASNADYKNADIFFFWDYPQVSNEVFSYILKSNKKLFLIATEPEIIVPMNYNIKNKDIFTKIFTWKESLVDNEKFFKITPITFSFPKNVSLLLFNERKLCAIIGTINRVYNYPGELYSKRLETVKWFEKNYPDDLDFFGRNTIYNDINHNNYKGEVKDKLSVLNQYKTCICYENNCSEDIGYITEKIFDAFFCGCIPIYWGSPDVNRIIPKECYIDRREFNTHEDLYNFIKNIDERQYDKYIEAINLFLKSEFAKSYNEYALSKTILKECFDIQITEN